MSGTYARTPEWRAALAERNRTKARKYPVGFDASSRLYRIWRAMYFRCYQKSHAAYPRYGGRGIAVYDEWRAGYPGFMAWALANGYREDLTLDRFPDQNGDYEPTNCRWATRSEQARNTKSNREPVEAFGESKTPIEWAEDPRCAVSCRLLVRRIIAGWGVETALTLSSQERSGPRPFSARQREGYRDPGRAL